MLAGGPEFLHVVKLRPMDLVYCRSAQGRTFLLQQVDRTGHRTSRFLVECAVPVIDLIEQNHFPGHEGNITSELCATADRNECRRGTNLGPHVMRDGERPARL